MYGVDLGSYPKNVNTCQPKTTKNIPVVEQVGFLIVASEIIHHGEPWLALSGVDVLWDCLCSTKQLGPAVRSGQLVITLKPNYVSQPRSRRTGTAFFFFFLKWVVMSPLEATDSQFNSTTLGEGEELTTNPFWLTPASQGHISSVCIPSLPLWRLLPNLCGWPRSVLGN